jgi:hypothetical protein
MAIQAQGHDQIGVVHFTMNVVILKQTIQKVSGNSSRFKPAARHRCERFQAGIPAEQAEGISPKAVLPLGFPPRSTDWILAAQSAPPANER